MTPTVITIGETMLRFTPERGRSLEGSDLWSVLAAGAESNVAVALARLGVPVGWVSRLPTSPLGLKVAGAVRLHGVDTSRVIWAEQGRQGLYFLDPGAVPRPAVITYDRAGSAMAQVDPEEVDWDYVRGARVVHLTGITPALGEGPHRLVRRTITEVHAAGGLVSFDVNYRSGLWRPEAARSALEPILGEVDLLIMSRGDFHLLFPEAAGGDEAALRYLSARFEPSVAVLTCGEEGALSLEDGVLERRPAVRAVEVDRVGRGDAFAAGFLHGYLGGGIPLALEHGTALAALKMTYPGDLCWATLEDLQSVLAGTAAGIVR